MGKTILQEEGLLGSLQSIFAGGDASSGSEEIDGGGLQDLFGGEDGAIQSTLNSDAGQERIAKGLDDVIDRDGVEQLVKQKLNIDAADLSKVDATRLLGLYTSVTGATEESIDDIISVLREDLQATDNEIIEALHVHVGLHKTEAIEILREKRR